MAYFQIPSKRTRQPSYPAQLSAEFAREIGSLAFSSNDVYGGSAWTTFGSGTNYSAGPYGLNVTQNAAGGLYLGLPKNITANGEVTFLYHGIVTSSSDGYAGLIGISNLDGSAACVQLQRNGSNSAWQLGYQGSDVTLGSDDPILNAGLVTIVVAGRSSGTNIYINGALWKSVVSTPSVQTSARANLFCERTAITYYVMQGSCYLRGYWGYGFSYDQGIKVSKNPWQIFAPEPRRLWWYGTSAGGTTTTIAPAAGALTVAGYAPSITQPRAVAPSKGSVSLTGYAPGIEQDIGVAPIKGALTVTGYAPTLTQPRSIAAVKGALTVTGYAPGVQQTASGTIAPSNGALALTGYAPSISQPRTIEPIKGAATLTGYAPGVVQNVTTFIAPSKGAITVAGYAPGVATTSNQAIAPTTGTLALAGYAPMLAQTASQTIGPIKGALTLTGYTPAVQVIGAGVTLVEPASGALSLNGYTPLVGLILASGALDPSRVIDRDAARIGAAAPSPRRLRLG